jgi:hypothetical protein
MADETANRAETQEHRQDREKERDSARAITRRLLKHVPDLVKSCRGDGVMETCGAYIRTASQEEFELPRGLGARHHAAAAITAVTDSTAVTVSESTGSVTIFRGGRIITEIQKPRSTTEKPRPHRVRRCKPTRRNDTSS